MIIQLLRINQWYKNLLIFLPLFFVQELFQSQLLFWTFLGFISLCLVSSSGYIINDIVDRKRDMLHPEKKGRPIAAGKIGMMYAFFIAMLLFAGSLFIASFLHIFFFIAVIAMFTLMQLYSLFFKHEAFADIIIIAINFVLRAASGAFIIQRSVSPWLILCIFFLSLFLSNGKRKADTLLLKKDAERHKKTLKIYLTEISDIIMIVSTAALIISYSLFSFLSIHPYLIFSLPFALYTTFYYVYLVYSGSIIARHPELIIKDYRMIAGIGLWLISTTILVYI